MVWSIHFRLPTITGLALPYASDVFHDTIPVVRSGVDACGLTGSLFLPPQISAMPFGRPFRL